ncbi:SIR2 family NAD-dependent protein deacylase [Nitrospira sp. M1]
MNGNGSQGQRELVKQVKDGNCILFLGAGVHAPPSDSRYSYPESERVPLGGTLASELAEEFEFKTEFPDDSPHDLQRVSLFIEQKAGRKVLVDSVKTRLRDGKRPSPALRMLAELPFKIIMTTNFDSFMESSLRKVEVNGQEKSPNVLVYDCDGDKPTEDPNDDPSVVRPILFKMHGDLEKEESLVLTDENYIHFIQRMSDKDSIHPLPETIKYRLRKWPTLFIGYSLKDYNLRLLFKTLRWRLDSSKFPNSFSVDRSPDPLLLNVWQNERRIISFISEDLWDFVPWLYKEVTGNEFTS